MSKEEIKDNSFGISSVILGILSIVISGGNGIILGIIGLFFSLKQKKISKNKWSKAGLILSIIGIILGIVAIIVVTIFALKNPQLISQIQNQIANANKQ